jgi:hypothetical protein
MRSPDGLVGGHDTPENMAVLNEILVERGEYNQLGAFTADPKKIDKLNPDYFEKRGNKFVAKDHPLYKDGAVYDDIKSGFSVTRDEADAMLSKASTKKSIDNWNVEYLETNKAFNKPSATAIIAALDTITNKADKELFLSNFDQCSPDEAVSFLNTNISKYNEFLDALDKSRKGKGKDEDDTEGDASASKAGRGEYILVLLIQGAKSAGSASGDILLPDNRAIEVKEVKDAGETWRATRASFGGKFNQIPFIDAINELISFCSGNQDHVNALMELAEAAGVKNKQGSGRGRKRDELDSLKKFFETADMNSLNISTTYGLETLGAHIRGINADEAENQIMAPNKVEFDVENQTSILKVNDIDPADLNKIQNPPKNPEEVTVTVSSIDKDKRKAELIIPRIKRLKFFRYEKKSMKDVYTPKNIAKSMFEAMSKKPGHYTGGIVFYNSKLGSFTYESNLVNLEYYFQSYQQTGPTFTKKEPVK